MKHGSLTILLVEDEEHDIFCLQQATEKAGPAHTLNAAHDGAEAVCYLQGQGQFADRQQYSLPNIILTDLKMPGMDGFEFLQCLREHPDYQIIPVVVYSSSALEADVRKAYRLGANSYMVKPSSIFELVELLRATYEYWSRCECPPMPATGAIQNQEEHPRSA
ncbi:MAG TPA: response regulator [Candidatus Sulfotelmatobacter sp.]|nr:response regulator [Candidatus Sulfotelmatobacter sp.]